MEEKRVQTRMLCADLVDVHWADASGHPCSGTANLEDISLQGVCLQLDLPLPPGTSVEISHGRGQFRGMVRYCVFREIGYFLGVEFNPGSQWNPTRFKPKHLLDLRQLVRQGSDAGPDAAKPDAHQ